MGLVLAAPVGLVAVRAASARVRAAPVRRRACRGASGSSSTWSSATRKPLPLPWLQIDDFVTHGADFAGPDIDAVGPARLRRPARDLEHRLVRARHAAPPDRRQPARDVPLQHRPSCGSPTSSRARAEARSVRSPRPIAWCRASCRCARRSPRARSGRPGRRKGLFEDPSLFAGVRPYQPGDPLRRIHWKATARVGRPVSRRYDPAREREVLIAVDMQTMPGASWMLNWDDDLVEGLCVAALSLARSFIEDGSRSVSPSMPSAIVRSARSTCRRAQRAARSRSSPTCSPMSARSPPSRSSACSPMSDAGRRPGCSVIALSGRDPIDFVAVPPAAQRPGLPCRATPRSDPRPASGAPGARARRAQRRRTASSPTGRPPLRSNASPESALAVLAACSLEAAWITLVYILVASLAAPDRGAAVPPRLRRRGPGRSGLCALVGAARRRLAYRARRWPGSRSPRPSSAGCCRWGLPRPGCSRTRPSSLSMHPGGLLLGLAVLRGSAHVDRRRR